MLKSPFLKSCNPYGARKETQDIEKADPSPAAPEEEGDDDDDDDDDEPEDFFLMPEGSLSYFLLFLYSLQSLLRLEN